MISIAWTQMSRNAGTGLGDVAVVFFTFQKSTLVCLPVEQCVEPFRHFNLSILYSFMKCKSEMMLKKLLTFWYEIEIETFK